MSTSATPSLEELKAQAIQAMSDGNANKFMDVCRKIGDIAGDEIITLVGKIQRSNLNPAHYSGFAKSCGINFNLSYAR